MHAWASSNPLHFALMLPAGKYPRANLPGYGPLLLFRSPALRLPGERAVERGQQIPPAFHIGSNPTLTAHAELK